MSAETAAILDKAADVIERNGWYQGSYFNEVAGRAPADCPVCTYGAIHIAAFGEPTPVLETEESAMGEANRAVNVLRKYLGITSVGAVWNDASDRTAEQVITALRGAAQAERERAS